MEYHIKEAAAKVGLPTHTLRYYEQQGLLPFIKETKTEIVFLASRISSGWNLLFAYEKQTSLF